MNKNEFMEKAGKLDFSMIKMKLTKADPNIARVWTNEGVDDAIDQYIKFMYILHKYSSTHKTVPSLEVDEIWHHHILDTRKYRSDCEACYGKFMDHFPYFGMRGADDFNDLNNSFLLTQELYFNEFGENMYEIDF